MKAVFIIFLFFLLSLFQFSFWKFNLVLLFFIFFTAYFLKMKGEKSFKKIYMIAFLTGLFMDLVYGLSLGLSSLFFLALSFLLFAYSRKLNPLRSIFLAIFVFIGTTAYSWLANNFFNWREGLFLALLSFIASFAGRYYDPGWNSKEIRLKT